MQLIQAEFSRQIKPGVIDRKIVWVGESWRLRKGHRVKFEGDSNVEPAWEVTKVYKTKIDAGTIERRWGLDLPKSIRTER